MVGEKLGPCLGAVQVEVLARWSFQEASGEGYSPVCGRSSLELSAGRQITMACTSVSVLERRVLT